MTVKAGQKCTAIRKAVVPASAAADVVAALQAQLAKTVVGDPRREGVRMGPLASLAQRREVLAQVDALRREADLVSGDPGAVRIEGADVEQGGFVPPLLLLCRDARNAQAVHSVEAFGPVCTVVPCEVSRGSRLAARCGPHGSVPAGSLQSRVRSCSGSRRTHPVAFSFGDPRARRNRPVTARPCRT